MDPTETDRFWQALSLQGAHVGQHKQAIHETMNSVQKLTTSVSQLSSRLDQIVTQLSNLASHGNAQASSAPAAVPFYCSFVSEMRKVGALMSPTTSSTTPSNWIQMQGMLRFTKNSVPVQVLVDSGADDNFIDSEFCTQANFLTETLPVPKEVFALNGQLVARVTHRTAPLSLQLSGNHQETISLFIIPSPTSSLVLGLPWLKLHSPHIDWSASSITNWSTFCHCHYLHSAIPSRVLSPTVPPDPID